MADTQDLVFRWQPCAGGARLLKVFGDTPCPVLPVHIGGQPVVEIGAYCFAARDAEGGVLYPADSDALHPISDTFVEEVTLPNSVRILHSAAFYNCRRLRCLRLGAAVDSLGSDLFTNCRALTHFSLRCAPTAPTGLKRLLGAVSTDIGVEFVQNKQLRARLFYPEYSEVLDENSPAHLFNRSIEGEGYRLRQCFDGGILNFTEYDDAFARAADCESTATLCRIALGRLQAPFALAHTAQRQYLRYLCAHPLEAVAPAIAARQADTLQLLVRQDILDGEARRRAALLCGEAGWSEGAALLLGGAKPRKKSYEFEDF